MGPTLGGIRARHWNIVMLLCCYRFVWMSTNKVTRTNKKVHNEWTPELQHVGQTEGDMWVWSAAATNPVRLPMTTCLFIGKGQVTPCTRVCFHVFVKQPGIFTTYVCFLCSRTGRCRFSSWGGRDKSLTFTNRQHSGGGKTQDRRVYAKLQSVPRTVLNKGKINSWQDEKGEWGLVHLWH